MALYNSHTSTKQHSTVMTETIELVNIGKDWYPYDPDIIALRSSSTHVKVEMKLFIPKRSKGVSEVRRSQPLNVSSNLLLTSSSVGFGLQRSGPRRPGPGARLRPQLYPRREQAAGRTHAEVGLTGRATRI